MTLEETLDLRRADEAHLSGPDGEQAAERDLDSLIGHYGFAPPSGALRHLAVDLLQAGLVEVARRSRLRLGDHEAPGEGHPVFAAVHALGAPPPAPAPALTAAQPLPAADLLKAWALEARPSPATLRKYESTFRTLARVLGFDDVRKIAVEDAIEFKEARLKAGISTGTVEDDIRAAGGICKWAVRNRKLAINPFDGTAPKASRRGKGDEDRAPYTDAEAQAILTKAREEKGWLRWGPWLLAFTGARPSELSEMARGDVREDGGVPILDFKPNAQRAGKNAIFQRMVPVHPALIVEGFLDYVRTLPDDAKGALFPDVTANARGERGVNAQASMSRWIHGTVKITASNKAPSYSWRHRMEDELRKVRALPEIQDAITGRYNPRNAGAGYGTGFRGMPAEVLVELSKIPSPVPPLKI